MLGGVFCAFLQTVHNKSRMLDMQRLKWISFNHEVRKLYDHYLYFYVLNIVGFTHTVSSKNEIKTRASKFKGCEISRFTVHPPDVKKFLHFHQIISILSYLHIPQQDPCEFCRMWGIKFQSNIRWINFKWNFKNKSSFLCLRCCIEETFYKLSKLSKKASKLLLIIFMLSMHALVR